MTTSTVSITDLQAFYNSDPRIKALIDLYGQRERGRQDSTPPRMRRVLRSKGIDLSTSELSDAMRQMQRMGLGRCVAGRNGKVSRFLWSYHLKSVADAAQGKGTTLMAPPKDRPRTPRLPDVPAPAVAPTAQAPVTQVPSDTVITIKRGLVEVVVHPGASMADLEEIKRFLNNSK